VTNFSNVLLQILNPISLFLVQFVFVFSVPLLYYLLYNFAFISDDKHDTLLKRLITNFEPY